MTQNPTFDGIMQELRQLANPVNVEGQKRFAIHGGEQLGVTLPELRRLAKGIKDHKLAQELWKSNVHEARLLATMIDDPREVTADQMNAWTTEFESWDICDQATDNLFIHTTEILTLIPVWAGDEREFVRRAAFASIAALAWNGHDTPDDVLAGYFSLIEKYAHDPRNFVKKAVNWALRNIGKRRPGLRSSAIEMAQRLSVSESPSARWVGKDALREFTAKFKITNL